MDHRYARHDSDLHGRFLHDLPQRLSLLQARLHGQCCNGWDINVLQQLHAELGTLSGRCRHHGQLELSKQLQALETALTPALTRMRLPDAGMTALVAALAEHLRQLIPSSSLHSASANRSAVHADGDTDAVVPLTPATRSGNDYRVLIAGTEAEMAKPLGAKLTAAGFAVRVLDEPLAALEELSRFAPQCILLGLHMPVVDGPELAAMIHQRSDFAEVPVLFLGADAGEATVKDVLPSNLPDADLFAIIRDHVDARRARNHDLIDLGRTRAPHRRAWLLDRLDATLTGDGAIRGGLLDISMDNARELHRHSGMAALVVIHEQLGKLLVECLEAGEMLAENGSGFLLLSRSRSRDGMIALADDIHVRVTRERFGPMATPLSVSMGGCVLNSDLDRTDAVLSAAQRARETSEPGSTGWHHRDAGQLDPLQLESALDNDRLHLVFQAILGMSGAAQPQYQALLRMRDNDGYVHTASELLPVARRCGLIPALDRWTLDRCLALLAGYQRRTRSMRLFVSQSSETLRKHEYSSWLGARLRASGVRGPRLVLEFRCDDIGAAPAELLRMAPRIRELGVGLCLSGVDRSLRAAELLDALALDYIKLAPNLSTNPAALVASAHARDISVICPQLEDPAAIAHLRGLGVDCVQGNSLAHPARALNYKFDMAMRSA